VSAAELVGDLDRAKALLASNGHTCVLANGDSVITSQAHGVAPMVDFIAQGIDVSGYAVADKVVGKAAALLFTYCGIAQVYTPVASAPALAVLNKAGIPFQADTVIPNILRADRTDICPMERRVADTADPAVAFARLSEAIAARRKLAQPLSPSQQPS
jgi:hypothetical protein